jgi:predicted Zn-dependent protease
MALGDAERRMASGDQAGASEVIERLLAADPDDCAALALKARLLLRAGQMDAALAVGELMDVRAPGDYRGPLAIGTALVAMGRYAEALQALMRAVQRAPDAAEVFALRADVHARLGQQQLAAADRARAAYLRS